jgi:flagellar biogenesis protein FliO
MSGSGGSLLLFLTASLLVIGLTYGASRMLGSWQAIQTRGRKLRVLEGVAVGKDRSLLLVAVGKEVLVVGASAGGIHMVHQVMDAETVAELLKPTPPPLETSVPGLPNALSALPKALAALSARLPAAPSAPAPGGEKLEASVRAHLNRMRGLLGRPGGGSNG